MSDLRSLIKQQKQYYQSIVSVFCPVLGETVYFSSEGFNHLIYESNRMPRKINEQFMKLKCLNFVTDVLTDKSAKIVDTRTYDKRYNGDLKVVIHYAIACDVQKGKKIRVIVERIGNGKFHFLSIMPNSKKKHNSRFMTNLKNKKHP